jgi:hypothetical protein
MIIRIDLFLERLDCTREVARYRRPRMPYIRGGVDLVGREANSERAVVVLLGGTDGTAWLVLGRTWSPAVSIAVP